MKRQKIINFLKSETVFVASFLLAIISACFVRPNKDYVGYIDYRVLSILFTLMLVVEGLSQSGFFTWLMQGMLKKISNMRGLVYILVFSTFAASMFITNDVALITFVPFTIMVLDKIGKKEMLIFVISIETVAANLGSMVLPTGNPQNLYLYSISEMDIIQFVVLLLPYTLVSLLLLAMAVLLIKNEKISLKTDNEEKMDGRKFLQMAALFIICILTVIRILPFVISLAIVSIVIIFVNKKIFCKADYILLLTFVMFFIFVGNMKSIDVIRDFLMNITSGHEIRTSIILSQFISNVPAAILLAGFTDDIGRLLIGVNIGGLGTLIASMASLISFKIFIKHEPGQSGKYIRQFTLICVIFLIILIVLNKIMEYAQAMFIG